MRILKITWLIFLMLIGVGMIVWALMPVKSISVVSPQLIYFSKAANIIGGWFLDIKCGEYLYKALHPRSREKIKRT